MTEGIKQKLGADLNSLLNPFHRVHGLPLNAVWESSLDDDIKSIDLEFELGFLRLTVQPDDDTVDIAFESDPAQNASRVDMLLPWRHYLGTVFGSGWVGFNQQGYLDSVFLAFGSAMPRLGITAIASRLQLTENKRVLQRDLPKREVLQFGRERELAKSA